MIIISPFISTPPHNLNVNIRKCIRQVHLIDIGWAATIMSKAGVKQSECRWDDIIYYL